MKFRPCIDLHAGQVKQIVGSTLSDSNQEATTENFSTDKPSEEFARLYQRDRLTGGHVIMLGPGNTEAAKKALEAYPQGLQVGGGINVDNAQEWLDAGASHIIVTSHVFHHGKVDWDRLDALVNKVGKGRLVLDLSCRSKGGVYYVVTDRWQTFTDVPVDAETLQKLGTYCNEFLVHGVDNEGKQCGILPDLVELLGAHSPIPVTYAGGVRHLDDLALVEQLGKGKVDVTIGSALDCFGGKLSYDKVVEWHHAQEGN
jgi:phosphoribosylformimino-5-aminoimidazole carboxamide ribotide isomerase|mmetsp:Transcript_7570/g.13658  ORF Transcript_7570/g.13658 Transcript_7570/m.13658 type:complete len:257 (-) Transcript_7570:246-1016(-)|eukprot:CAMPEP_0198298422 /NCGR_PEP_ID=MMETSP1449-20131203/40870_1 /TAXON_ID=420275 /ORGANISM="Attheya septentrionalis, Strain CCMP2084" /LENGTH=256 /DNA_ID=CAMNT_0043999681 /DNA_START=223 /DNA_END=993 /DNA_ORIENTATION=-